MRRSAVSVPSNIAERAGRKNDKEFIQFLYVAVGSFNELETQMIITINLRYVSDSSFTGGNRKTLKIITLLHQISKIAFTAQWSFNESSY